MHEQTFPLRRSLDLALEHVGSECEPVLTVERALEAPEALVDYAANEVDFSPAWGVQGGYPGVRAPAPLNYVEALVRALDPLIRRAFALQTVKLARAQCNFSMVTLAPEELKPLQRVPHIDTVDPLQFAILHYLCPPEAGGTALYRHRATGFETIHAGRLQRFHSIRDWELEQDGAEHGYIAGDSPHYAQTASFAASFDRVIVYRSHVLHSGQIDARRLSANAREGRLTANIFVNYRA